jgi:hypothetical protein
MWRTKIPGSQKEIEVFHRTKTYPKPKAGQEETGVARVPSMRLRAKACFGRYGRARRRPKQKSE